MSSLTKGREPATERTGGVLKEQIDVEFEQLGSSAVGARLQQHHIASCIARQSAVLEACWCIGGILVVCCDIAVTGLLAGPR